MMDQEARTVIYLDRRVQPQSVRRDGALERWNGRHAHANLDRLSDTPEVVSNVELLSSVFQEVDVHHSGSNVLHRITQPPSHDKAPIIVLIATSCDDTCCAKNPWRQPRSPSPTATRKLGQDVPDSNDLCGMQLLRHIRHQRFPRPIIPVMVLTSAGGSMSGVASDTLDTSRMSRYLAAGAVDVLTSPLSKDNVSRLVTYASRRTLADMPERSGFLAQSKGRKVSWVGVNDNDSNPPFAYLREAMVSNLMGNICCPDTAAQDPIKPNDIKVSPARKTDISRAVATWDFSAHDWTDDELLFASLVMLKHALTMPEVEKWRMEDDQLLIFLQASRDAYNEFVLYHNFRHVVDVLQALFYFLLHMRALPAYPATDTQPPTEQPAIASLITPFDALTLLISAIGHDVGHPGVNNAFLVALNAPLAQLYNDRSVLESFHCAAYSQILRRFWPAAFEDATMRKLMINSILATDMSLHSKYMADLGNLQAKLAHNGDSIDGWSPTVLCEYRDLLCGLLIKCADISNVARSYQTAVQWAKILTDEFGHQGEMEKDLALSTCLFGGPPARDDPIKLGESQIGFMNMFARPLFESVAGIIPSMSFSVVQISENKRTWQTKIKQAKERAGPHMDGAAERSGSSILEQARSPLSTSRVDVSSSMPVSPERTESAFSLSRAPIQSLQPPKTAESKAPSLNATLEPRRSSIAALPIPRHLFGQGTRAGPHSRRGSVDASLTTILVTHIPNSPSESWGNEGLRSRSQSPGKRRNSRQGLAFFRRADRHSRTDPPFHARENGGTGPDKGLSSPQHDGIDTSFKTVSVDPGLETPSLADLEVKPPGTSNSSADKSARTTSELPASHTLAAGGAGATGRPKSRGGIFSKLRWNKGKADKMHPHAVQYTPPSNIPVDLSAAGSHPGLSS